MTARFLVVLALVALLAGCGGSKHATPPPATTACEAETQAEAEADPRRPQDDEAGRHHPRRRQARARARCAGEPLGQDRSHRPPRRHDDHGAAGEARRLRLGARLCARQHAVNFQHSRWQTVDVYQPDLQWPLYGATEARTQAPTKIRLRPPFRLVWSRGLGHLIEFPAVVADGYAYIGNARGTVRAISMRSGDFAWTHLTPGFPRMASSPAVDGDDVVYHTMGGGVYVLDRNTGHLRWSWNAGSAIESSPIVVNDIDYFGTASGEMYALDLRTHQLKWRKYLGAKITSSAAISGGRLFIGDYDGRLWALSPESGATRWVGRVNGKIYGTPAVAGGRVFVPSVSYSLWAFSTSGRRLWSVSTGSYVYSSPAVADGVVCFGAYNGVFYGVSAGSGRALWRVPTGGPISGASVIVDGVAYVGSFAGRILGVNLHTGRRLLTFPHGEYVPVSGNGARLLFNGFSRIYAVEPRHSRRRRLAH